MKHFNSTTPRYTSTPDTDDDSSSTHSVRVSRLIEKIKQTQRSNTTNKSSYHPEAFSYVHGNNNNDLIYSRIERDDSTGKRTVRERVAPFNSRSREFSRSFGGSANYNDSRFETNAAAGNHKTTVLLNSDTSDYDGGFTNNTRSNGTMTRGQRYFGEETDYEYDRELSKSVRSKFNATRTTASSTTRGSVPKIILHEEAVAEIPNGKPPRSPSREFDESAAGSEYQGGSRFLGGLLTLKRGNKKHGSSVTSGAGGGGTIRSTRSPSTRPSYPTATPSSQQQDSPKYYIPYRSTPTLYESRYERDRMSSTGGSVLSNSSYVNKHVSRSMSMKAPWEPKHRTNEINYYDNSYKKHQQELPTPPDKKSNLSRSKSMPGKKLTSLIGNWVSKNNNKASNIESGNENEKLLQEQKQTKKESKTGKASGTTEKKNWGFTLLRFGKSKEASKEKKKDVTKVTQQQSNAVRTSVSPVRLQVPQQRYSTGPRNGSVEKSRSGTLSKHERSSTYRSAAVKGNQYY